MGFVKDIVALVKGMTITSKHLGRHAVTVQYPEQRDTIPERSRGIVVLLSDQETGEANCTSCLLCMRACPTAAIKIVSPRGEDKKRHLQEFVVDNTLCCFCGLCEEACNFTAIKMAQMYEFSTIDKTDLVWDLKKLLEMGKDVPYTPKPKKAKPAPQPAEAKTDAPKADAPAGETAPAESGSSDKPKDSADSKSETKPEEGS